MVKRTIATRKRRVVEKPQDYNGEPVRGEGDPAAINPPPRQTDQGLVRITQRKLTSLDSIAEEIGGRDRFVEIMLMAGGRDDKLASMLTMMLQKPDISIHDIAMECHVDVVLLVGKLASTLYGYNMGIAKMLNGLAQPEVMRASIDSAKILGKEGFADRELQFKMSGLLQEQKAPLVNVNIGAGGMESQEDFIKDITGENV